MRKALLVALWFPIPLAAQIISITDHDLAVKMKVVAPLAVDTVANTIDNSHPQALGIPTFFLGNSTQPITDLTGLAGFANLLGLYVGNIGVAVVDDLPATLIELTFSGCSTLTSVTNLPAGLTQFGMTGCNPGTVGPLPNTITSLNLADWTAIPSTIVWPSALQSLQLQDLPMAVLKGVPDGVTFMTLSDLGLTSIVDANNVPHLPAQLGSWANDYHSMTSLPPLPATMTWMRVYGGPLTSVPALPASLLNLSLQQNDLAGLPTLPAGLEVLEVDANPLSALPALPASLRELRANATDLTVLPALPAGLEVLEAGSCQLTSLPALGTELEELSIRDNIGITALPSLPDSLVSLDADHCSIAALPPLPAGMGGLDVSFNPLTSLPALPPALITLGCGWCNLTAMPPLPLSLLSCDARGNAALVCAPWLPAGLVIFQALNTGIQCIPNDPPGFNENLLGIPLVICDILTPCPTLNPGMMGTSYIDLNGDGVRDAGEPPLMNATLELSPNNFIGGTGTDGRYVFGLDNGTYSVTGIPALYQSISSAPATATFTAPQQVDSLNDVGYTLVPSIQDLVMDITDFTNERPGFDSHYQLSYRNAGTQTQSGSVSFTYDPAMTFVISVPVPDVFNGNTLTWNFTALQINEQRGISTTLNTSVGTALGTPIAHTAVTDPLATDQTPADNAFAYSSIVVGSYDPNDKQVEPTQLTPAQVATGERVDYTIRFQNTGTSLAERVVITDTLSSDLQWNSIQLVASSHELIWYMSNGLLYLVFNDINLPDSTSDEPNSHGFVKFSMQPVSSLMLGATVENVANIYFDYNDPIITDAAVFTVNDNVGLEGHDGTGILLYPNPVDDVLTITMTGSPSVVLEVVDVMGRIVLRTRANGTRIQLPVDGLKAGLYQVRTEGGPSMARFVKR